MANPLKKAQDGGAFTQGMIKSTDGAATNETRNIRGKMEKNWTDGREIFVVHSANSIPSNYKNSEKCATNITQIANPTTIQATLDCGAEITAFLHLKFELMLKLTEVGWSVDVDIDDLLFLAYLVEINYQR